MQTWFADGSHLVGLAAFLAAVVLAFLAGYLAGRAGRPDETPPPAHRRARPAPRDAGGMRPLPAVGSEEAILMDLTAIRDADAEPPPPIGPEPPRRR